MNDAPRLPPGACDCHTHVIGAADRYPMIADRHYTPGSASVEDLREHLSRLGLTRAIVVQPSVYGTDNRCLLDALARMNGDARGVAVVEPSTSDATLAALHEAGVRGLRLNLESAGARDSVQFRGSLDRWSGRLAGLGWHLQVFAALETLMGVADHVATLPIPVVFDHFAMVEVSTEPTDAIGRTLLDLMTTKRVYVKLSAPYRIAPGAPDVSDEMANRWSAVFRATAPTQLLWASDWPHTNREPGKRPHEVSAYRDIRSTTLAGSMADWLPDEGIRQQVLVDNPARLYGF